MLTWLCRDVYNKLHQLFGLKYSEFKYGYHLTVMRKNETKLVLDTVTDIAQLSLLDNQRSDQTRKMQSAKHEGKPSAMIFMRSQQSDCLIF